MEVKFICGISTAIMFGWLAWLSNIIGVPNMFFLGLALGGCVSLFLPNGSSNEFKVE